MVDRVHPAQEVGEEVAVANVAFVEVCFGAQVGGLAIPVDGRREGVEDHDVVAEGQEPVARVGADKAGPACNQDLHLVRLRCSPTSR